MVDIIPGRSSLELGTLKFSWQKILLLIIFILSTLLLSFFVFNIGAYKEQATGYWILDITTIALIALSFGINYAYKIGDWSKPLLYEDSILGGKQLGRSLKAIMFFTLPAIIGIFLFFSVAGTPSYQISLAPHYQVIEPSQNLNLFLTIASTFSEDFFMWATLLPFSMFLLKLGFTKLKIPAAGYVAIAVAILVMPTIWTLYHVQHYGASDTVASQKVFMVGLIWTIWTLATRNIMLPLFMHAANNMGLDFFSTATSGYAIFAEVALIILVIGITIYYLRRKRRQP